MEATGHYWLSLYSFLIENHFVVYVINPIQTDGWRKGTEIRKLKTDIIDSTLIADFIRCGNFLDTSLADEDTMSLRNLLSKDMLPKNSKMYLLWQRLPCPKSQ